MKRFWIAVLSLWVMGLATPQASAQEPDVAAGKKVYKKLCATCHGANGNGKGMAAAALDPKPASFTDKARMSKRTDADLKTIILKGGQSKGLAATMAAFEGAVSDKDADALVAYIRSLAKK